MEPEVQVRWSEPEEIGNAYYSMDALFSEDVKDGWLPLSSFAGEVRRQEEKETEKESRNSRKSQRWDPHAISRPLLLHPYCLLALHLCFPLA